MRYALGDARIQTSCCTDARSAPRRSSLKARRFIPEQLARARPNNWLALGAADPKFKKVYDSYNAFCEKGSTWRGIGYL